MFEPWQVFIEANIFGWVKKDTGKRRSPRRPTKRFPGRTANRPAWRPGIYLFAADGESGAEVYPALLQRSRPLRYSVRPG
ncbi:hypothetical protein ACPA9J_15850 [Pseudomonas aeruginosa]